ncbi:TolC family protein [Chitinophaga sp. LS1]|uniref:TolC family protein n=1 Tax=Chitinophaga sp. LS1 TaxID=3051176 RepID=UPI002AAC1C01|nr:TolC family protein [Chitinophaga sp. LS1]WPV65637.1 TolC family protein [Chitinophaga sp. LS1]
MKRMMLGFVSWLLLFQANSAAQEKADTLRLKDCIQFALGHHENSLIYANKVTASKEAIRESKSVLLPTVSGNASFDYNLKLQTSVIPAGALSEKELHLQMGSKYSTGAYLQADETLFDKANWLNIKSAKTDKDLADLNLKKQQELIVYNTVKAYYNVLSYAEKVRLLKENEKEYLQLEQILKLRYEQGVVKKSSYDKTRVDLNNIQTEISSNENYYRLALNQLKKEIGADLETEVAISTRIKFDESAPSPGFTNLPLTQLTDYNIDLQQLRKQEIAAQQKKAAFLPTLSLYAKYGVNAYGTKSSDAFNDWFDYSVIGMKLSVPIFSGFKKQSQYQQSKIALTNQQLTAALNARTYKLDFQDANANLYSSYTTLIKNKENLSLASELLSEATVEFKEGKTDLSSYLDTEYSYKESQSNYINSLIDYLNAKVAMEKANGSLLNYVNNLE